MRKTSYVVVLATMSFLWACTTSSNGNEERPVVHPILQQPLLREQRTRVLATKPAPAAVGAHTAVTHLGVNNPPPLLLLELTAIQAAPYLNAENETRSPTLFDALSHVVDVRMVAWSGGQLVAFLGKADPDSTEGSPETVSSSASR
jgi:hypothetical protein